VFRSHTTRAGNEVALGWTETGEDMEVEPSGTAPHVAV